MKRPFSEFLEMINQHPPMFDRQLFKVVRLPLQAAGYGDTDENQQVNIEIGALELLNQVLDIFCRDDNRGLRQFKGDMNLSAYITAILVRQGVGVFCKKLEGNRHKPAAVSSLAQAILLASENAPTGIAGGHWHGRI